MAKQATAIELAEQYGDPRPFLKWVGGKRQILHELRKSIPKLNGRYYEPFVGGGALFFDLLPKKATLSDTNKELIHCYITIRDHVEDLIDNLKQHVYQKEHYYEVRAWDPDELDHISRASRTLYLNRCGFNGLYRVNSKGKFNVPFGRYKNPTICDEENLIRCAMALKRVTIRCAPFESILKTARAGDLVYFDPPYIPLSDTSYFTAYQKQGFAESDQKRLVEVFDRLSTRGVFTMLSNSDVPWVHEHYQQHEIRIIKAIRLINSNKNRRGPVGEVVITNF